MTSSSAFCRFPRPLYISRKAISLVFAATWRAHTVTPLRRFADRVAPLATARMAVDRMGHPSIPALEECAAFVQSFAGPKAMVWGRRDPVLARALKRTRALLGNPPVTETQAGHFLQEEVPDEIAAAVLEVNTRLSRGSSDAAEQQA